MNHKSLALGLIVSVLAVLTITACSKKPVVGAANVTPFTVASLGIPGDYQMSPYPVDNFGVFTAYRPPAGQKWGDSNQICATWDCLGIDFKDVPKDADVRLHVDGFAAVGSGGLSTLSSDQKNSFAINLLLPGLAQLLDIKGNVDWTKDIKGDLTLGNAHKRILDRQKAIAYITGLPSTSQLRQAFDKGELVLIVADYVVDSLDATITVNKDLNAGANAALSTTAQAAKLPFGKDANGKTANLDGKLESQGNGKYHLQINNPVVVAVLPKTQPAAGTLAGPTPGDSWTDWVLVTTPIRRKLQP